MRALSDWFYANKLSLNVLKNVVVVFAPKNTNNNITSITLGNKQILRVNNAIFLGIYLEDGLELSSGTYAIHTVKGYMSVHNLKSL